MPSDSRNPPFLYLAKREHREGITKTGIMAQKIIDGISVFISIFYQNQYSDPIEATYVFVYPIQVEKQCLYPVQLLYRFLIAPFENG